MYCVAALQDVCSTVLYSVHWWHTTAAAAATLVRIPASCQILYIQYSYSSIKYKARNRVREPGNTYFITQIIIVHVCVCVCYLRHDFLFLSVYMSRTTFLFFCVAFLRKSIQFNKKHMNIEGLDFLLT